jgi:lipopolysaccharide export system ATP-binding protein
MTITQPPREMELDAEPASSVGGNGAGRGRSVLRAQALTKSYGRRVVVRTVNVDIRQGEIVGLLGPNGAGKTTTFYMVVGLTRPDSGHVYLDKEDITGLPMYLRARQGIGYLPQEASIFRKLTTEENVRAILETRGLSVAEQRSRARALLEELGIFAMARQQAYTLSGGERRRLEICRALASEPSFILLDEPFAGIDPIAVIDIQKIIAHLSRRGIGVLITDHNVRETLKITDRAYILRDGHVFRSGTPRELASDGDVRKVYLGEGFTLDERPEHHGEVHER